VDVFDTGFTYSIDSPGADFSAALFNGVRLYDPGALAPDFVAVDIVGTTFVGFDATRLTFDADNIYFDLAGLTTPPSGPATITFSVTTVAAVPEPASWALLAGGLVVIGGAIARRWPRTRG
jgi:hypothetical protein